MKTQISDSKSQQIAELCKRNQISELSLFGSRVREDYTDESDFDFLVDFLPEARIGFLALGKIERELTKIIGRKVDLVPKKGLKKTIRRQVIEESIPVYAK